MPRSRSEDDDWMDGDPAQVGTAEPVAAPGHSPHAFLYIPDASTETGLVAHRVPDRELPPTKRPLGFRRAGR